MIKAIVFDVDGVIINTEGIHFEAFKDVLIKYDYELSHENYLKHFSGKTILGGIKSLTDCEHVDFITPKEEFFQRIVKEKIAATIDQFRTNLTFFDSTLRFINKIRESNTKLKQLSIESPLSFAYATGLERILMAEVLKHEYLNNFFTIHVPVEEYSRSKPDPDCYLTVLKKLNLNPSEVIGIEDSESGIKALNSAGIFSIGVTTTHKRDNISHAKMIVDSLEELIDD
jgi:beta-phosphoglucomutase